MMGSQFGIRLCWAIFFIAVLANLFGIVSRIKLIHFDMGSPEKVNNDLSMLKLFVYSGLSSALALGVFTARLFR
jgi:hypothetical protein